MQECSAPKGIVFSPFWSENEYRLCPFLSEIGYGFRENYGNVWMYLSFQFQSNKKEREVCKFEMNFKKSFCWRSNLSKWWHNFLEASSENGCKKWACLVCNRVRTYRIGRHNPTKNSQEYLPLSPPPPCLGIRWCFLKLLFCRFSGRFIGMTNTISAVSSAIKSDKKVLNRGRYYNKPLDSCS